VQSSARFAQLPRFAWLLIVIGLMLALGAAALAVGARIVKEPPSPFGADSRGSVLYATADGDIHALDTATNQSRPLTAGPAIDGAPLASPDGAVFAFQRREPGASAATLMVANADGSNVRSFEGRPEDVVGMAWSPDGDRLAVSAGIGGVHGLWILPLDGGNSLVLSEQPLDDIALIREPHWRPNGEELLFRGETLDLMTLEGLYVVGADGGGLRAIVEPTVDGPAEPAVSPDGTKIAYALGKEGQARLHVIEIDTGNDAVIALDASASDQRPTWSPDGRSLAFERYRGETYRLAVAPVAGGPAIELGPTQPRRSGGSGVSFSPDGARIVAFYDADDSSWVLDPVDGSAIPLPHEIATPLTWQRTPG
jgi:TolB protein